MALPLAVRNRLAELILEAFDHDDARAALLALAAFCREPDGRLDAAAEARLSALGWFQSAVGGGLKLLGAHGAHLPALCRRAETAGTVFHRARALPEGRTLSGVLARAGLLAGAGLFFEVHELLEPVWMRAEGRERLALQGLIQVAVAFHHAENGNREGAVSLLTEGLAKLRETRTALPLDTTSWEPSLLATLTALREGRPVPPGPRWPEPALTRDAAWHSS